MKIFFLAIAFAIPVAGHAADFKDLKHPLGFVLLKTTFDDIKGRWGEGKTETTSSGAGHLAKVTYRCGEAKIVFSGTELAGDAIDYFSLSVGSDAVLPAAPVKCPFDFAGFRLGMTRTAFLKNLESLSAKPQSYSPQKLMVKTSHVEREFTRTNKVKIPANSRWSMNKAEHLEDQWDMVRVTGDFSSGKLTRVSVYTTLQ